jgi:predicted nucleotidyltransferase
MSDEHATAAVSWRIALDRFITAIRSVYGTRVHSFVLYGSRARGDAELGSDIDVLVIRDHIADFWSEHRRTATSRGKHRRTPRPSFRRCR